MSLFNPRPWIIPVSGDTETGRTPTQLRVIGPSPLTRAQFGSVQQIYGKFAHAGAVSVIPFRSFRTRLPDGSLVEMVSNHGVDTVVVWPSGADEPSGYETLFVCIPCDQTNVNGIAYGESSENISYATTHVNSIVQDVSVLKPYGFLDSTVDANHPGNTTWFGNDPLITISWWGPSCRYRQDPVSHPYPGQSVPTDIYSGSGHYEINFVQHVKDSTIDVEQVHRRIWLNGIPISFSVAPEDPWYSMFQDVSFVLVSAALARDEDAGITYLRALFSRPIYRKPDAFDIDNLHVLSDNQLYLIESRINVSSVFEKSKNEVTWLTPERFEALPGFSAFHLVQPMFFNRSGTRAAGVIALTLQPGDLPSGYTAANSEKCIWAYIVEIDVSSSPMAVTKKELATYSRADLTRDGSQSITDGEDFSSSSTSSISSSSNTVGVIAVDYSGDLLKALTFEAFYEETGTSSLSQTGSYKGYSSYWAIAENYTYVNSKSLMYGSERVDGGVDVYKTGVLYSFPNNQTGGAGIVELQWSQSVNGLFTRGYYNDGNGNLTYFASDPEGYVSHDEDYFFVPSGDETIHVACSYALFQTIHEDRERVDWSGQYVITGSESSSITSGFRLRVDGIVIHESRVTQDIERSASKSFEEVIDRTPAYYPPKDFVEGGFDELMITRVDQSSGSVSDTTTGERIDLLAVLFAGGDLRSGDIGIEVIYSHTESSSSNSCACSLRIGSEGGAYIEEKGANTYEQNSDSISREVKQLLCFTGWSSLLSDESSWASQTDADATNETSESSYPVDGISFPNVYVSSLGKYLLANENGIRSFGNIPGDKAVAFNVYQTPYESHTLSDAPAAYYGGPYQVAAYAMTQNQRFRYWRVSDTGHYVPGGEWVRQFFQRCYVANDSVLVDVSPWNVALNGTFHAPVYLGPRRKH